MRRTVLWPLMGLAVLVGLAVVLAIAGWLYVHSRFDTPGPARDESTVILPPGLGAFDIADRLEEAGVIDDPVLFVAGLWIEDKQHSLKAGEYVFEALVTPRGVMEKLVDGDTVAHRLTIKEGMTSAEIVAALNAAPGLEGEIEKVPDEGSLLPETYHYALGDSRAGLIERMKHAMARVVDELWQARDPAVGLDDADQAVVLASIVEKETAVADERPIIAGVFLNRLRQGMRLQADVTVIYAVTEGKRPLGRRLSRADLWVREPLQYLPPRRTAPRVHRQSRAGGDRGSPESGRYRRTLFRRRRLRRTRLRGNSGRAQPQRRALARQAPCVKEIAASRRPDEGHGQPIQHDRLRPRERRCRRSRLELGGQERQRAGAGYPLPLAARAGTTRPGGSWRSLGAAPARQCSRWGSGSRRHRKPPPCASTERGSTS